MQKRRNKTDDSLIKPWHILVLAALALGGVFYSYSALQKAYTFDPEKTYAEFFTNSRDRITDLTGDGTISSIYDLRIHFQSPDIIRWRKPQFVTMEKADRAWHYFTDRDPHDQNVFNLADLELWSYYEHPDPVKLVNAWLLHNKKTNHYYFRAWGRN
jgi:hypothetical protein